MNDNRPISHLKFQRKSVSASKQKLFLRTARQSEPDINIIRRSNSNAYFTRTRTSKIIATNVDFCKTADPKRPLTENIFDRKITLFRDTFIKDNITRGESLKIREKLAEYDTLSKNEYFSHFYKI